MLFRNPRNEIFQTLRSLIRFIPKLPPQAAFVLYNYLIGRSNTSCSTWYFVGSGINNVVLCWLYYTLVSILRAISCSLLYLQYIQYYLPHGILLAISCSTSNFASYITSYACGIFEAALYSQWYSSGFIMFFVIFPGFIMFYALFCGISGVLQCICLAISCSTLNSADSVMS